MRIFIDANVFYSAIYSSTGASREIILMGIRGEVTLVVSRLILEEVERNLTNKAPETLPLFRQFVDAVPFEIVEPTRREVLEAMELATNKMYSKAPAFNYFCGICWRKIKRANGEDV